MSTPVRASDRDLRALAAIASEDRPDLPDGEGLPPSLLAAGHTNTQIARRLGISEGTVRTHLENIYDKLHVSSRTAAVTRAFPDRTAQRLAQCGRACPGPAAFLPCRAT